MPRQIALLPALLLGWASLAACAILPGRQPNPCHGVATLVHHASWTLLKPARMHLGFWVMGCDACGPLHAGSWWRARQEMAKLIANYDSSTAGDALLRALVACGASDVAHSLSQSRSATQVCHRLLHLWIPCFCAGACSFVEEGPPCCKQHNFVVDCLDGMGCRCPLLQRLLRQRWRASGTHWWQEPWRRTESLIITLGETKKPCND